MAAGSSPRLRGTGAPGYAAVLVPRFIPAPAGNGRGGGSCCTPFGGSSPRLRGTERGGQCQDDECRFIPAPAGNGCWPRWHASRLPVHPRACGERLPVNWLTMPLSGSSPRLRGTGGRAFGGDAENRFIPAPAGNGVSTRSCRSDSRGSSPRLRGTAAMSTHAVDLLRFIPAPAGNGPQGS